jgi:YgiT-type zinc finger domain-containing protein
VATIPFLLKGAVVVVKDVPAEICAECDEPFLAGVATDEVLRLLTGLRSLNTEVSVLTYPRAAHGRQVEPNAATAAVR